MGVFYVLRHRLSMAQCAQGSPALVSPFYTYYRNWILTGFWITLHDYLRRRLRWVPRAGKAKTKCGHLGTARLSKRHGVPMRPRGYDAGKKINGSKRHLVVGHPGLGF